ncbi:hypothetical protein ASD8599_02596 [Ascidiaceihabitans donghaensis]|uniref:Uncharacterized protein n=1 Tax=Ascidiaceihabitans donghaensis TaxID=1510460 RepID=A0A2R8BFV9_9RHOB|nr:hypothetical protein ASD8599_02596 [Ascidiaceihabitans donghaensis]
MSVLGDLKLALLVVFIGIGSAVQSDAGSLHLDLHGDVCIMATQ